MDIESQKVDQQQSIDFPEIECPIHKSKIVLVCPIQDCKDSTFLCPQCINSDIKHLNEHSPFMTLQQFVSFLAKQVQVGPEQSDSNVQEFIQQEQKYVREFAEAMDKQKKSVQSTMSSLNHLYEEKCSELVKQLKEKFDSQHKLFIDTFKKCRQQYRSDKEADANLPKFSELKMKVQNMSSPNEIQNYLRDIYIRKQNWEKASESVKTLGKRTEDAYRRRIEEFQMQPPKFMNPDQVVAGWCVGFNGLIDSMSHNSSIFENLVAKSAEIYVEIVNVNEIKLLTQKMIKEDTVLSLLLSERQIEFDEAKEIEHGLNNLENLERLSLELSSSKLSSDSWQSIISPLNQLKNLKKLCLFASGTSFQDKMLTCLALNLANSNGIEELHLDLSGNGVGDAGCQELANLLQNQTNLKNLNLQLSANSIKSKGVEYLGKALENLINLESLTISLGGFSLKHNKVKDEGVCFLANGLKNLKLLTHLNLDIGYNEITDSSLIELTYSLRELPRITKINLDLYQNSLENKGTQKLGKCLGKSQVKDLKINLQSNEIEDDGVKELFFGLKKASQLTNLIINMRNCGLSKKLKTSLRNDIKEGKSGKEYLVLNLLF